MKPFRALGRAIGAAVLVVPLAALSPADDAAAQTPSPTEKLNAYVGCINRLSERSYDSRSRYFSWAAKSGPTGKERIIYGTYAIYDTSDCKKNVEKANAMEPHDAALETAATAYADAVSKLEPLLKETDDYYSQENYKDDKMAKGKALHPRLVAAWDAFASADQKLRGEVEAINDRRALEKLAEIEKSEGRKTRYYVEALMIQAKRVLRAEDAKTPDAKSYLVTAKQLMRRIRDKVPYSSGDKMMLSNAGSGWMVEGSPPRLLRDYNQVVESYNRGANI
jgi:hypothetical protein